MKHQLILTHNEVHKLIPYMLIAETTGGSRWNRMKRRVLWKQWFSDEERHKLYGMIRRANNWALVKGVPDKVRMDASTLKLWQRLGNFCLNL